MNMESPYNSEGLLNHHRGDGANHIVTKGDEYYDISPVYDYMKIPGATIVQKEKLPNHNTIKKIGTADFVGAVTDGKYGVVGFDFKSPHDPLVARKSWFFFNEEYVCLGAGISTKMKNKVNTTLNQSLLRGEVVVSTEGKTNILEAGKQMLSNIDWIHHDNITYLFPKPQTIFVKNEIAKGSWWRISKQISSSKDTVKLAVFKAWINHGKSPSNASYEYIVKPGALSEFDKQRNFSSIQILSNTPYLQAVKNTDIGIIQMVFYSAGEIKVSEKINFKCHTPGIVMLKMDENMIQEVSVSDPNRELSQINFSINYKIDAKGKGFKSQWNEENNISSFLVALPQGNFQGSTVKIKL
jgi:chondroitin AC lyase